MAEAFIARDPALPTFRSDLIKAPTTLLGSSPSVFFVLNKPQSFRESVATMAVQTTVFPRQNAHR